MEGRFGVDDPLGEKFVLGWTKWVYIFSGWKAKKLIPVKRILWSTAETDSNAMSDLLWYRRGIRK